MPEATKTPQPGAWRSPVVPVAPDPTPARPTFETSSSPFHRSWRNLVEKHRIHRDIGYHRRVSLRALIRFIQWTVFLDRGLEALLLADPFPNTSNLKGQPSRGIVENRPRSLMLLGRFAANTTQATRFYMEKSHPCATYRSLVRRRILYALSGAWCKASFPRPISYLGSE